MPHFYMHMRRGRELVLDPDGADFASLAAVRSEAVLAAREIMSDRVLRGEAPNGSEFEITDEDGAIVMVIRFRDAIAH